MAFPRTLYIKLSIMMILEYAILGAWYPIIPRLLFETTEKGGLGFSAYQVGTIVGVSAAAGALLSPLTGQLADRKFNAERCLAFLLVTSAGLKWITATQTTFGMWFGLTLISSILFVPTISLCNSIAFAHVDNADRDFPLIRLWSSPGWIAASWVFPWVFLQYDLSFQAKPPFLVGTEYADVTARLALSLKFAAGISVVLAIYCLTLLPKTPPKTGPVEKPALFKAFGLFRRRSFALLVLACLPMSVLHQVYNIKMAPYLSFVGFRDSSIGPVLTLAQCFEILAMTLLSVLLLKIGFRWTLLLGILTYIFKHLIFGTLSLPKEVVTIGVALHGFSYAWFFAAGHVYVERLSSADVRHSAQMVFGIIVLGVGPAIGGILLGLFESWFTPEGGQLQYGPFWYFMAGVAVVMALLLAALFRDEAREESPPVIEPEPEPEGKPA